MTVLDRFETALAMFLEIRRATFVWTRALTGEGPATIQRTRRQMGTNLDATPAR